MLEKMNTQGGGPELHIELAQDAVPILFHAYHPWCLLHTSMLSIYDKQHVYVGTKFALTLILPPLTVAKIPSPATKHQQLAATPGKTNMATSVQVNLVEGTLAEPLAPQCHVAKQLEPEQEHLHP